jgi:hypothetical protein
MTYDGGCGYLSDFIIRHAVSHVGLVGKDQDAGAHQALRPRQSGCRGIRGAQLGDDLPLRVTSRPIPHRSPQRANGRWCRPPRPARRSFQSNSSNMSAMSSAPRRPLRALHVSPRPWQRQGHRNTWGMVVTQMLSL